MKKLMNILLLDALVALLWDDEVEAVYQVGSNICSI